MLDFMRRQHKNLKWVLVLVIFVLGASMVVGFIPFGDLSSMSFSSDVAKVGSETVSATEFQTAYTNYMRSLQQKQQLSPEILKAFPRTRGPQTAPKKIPVSIRLSAEVVERFKATGPGWQSRIDAALKKAVGL